MSIGFVWNRTACTQTTRSGVSACPAKTELVVTSVYELSHPFLEVGPIEWRHVCSNGLRIKSVPIALEQSDGFDQCLDCLLIKEDTCGRFEMRSCRKF